MSPDENEGGQSKTEVETEFFTEPSDYDKAILDHRLKDQNKDQ